MNIKEKVDALILDCLNGKEEGAQKVEGLVHGFGFNPDKIKQHREEIKELLDQMPLEFHPAGVGGGGGYTFLNLPFTRDGEQWGEQRDAEALLCLGIAAGMATILVPRSVWNMFPGGVPYCAIDTSEKSSE